MKRLSIANVSWIFLLSITTIFISSCNSDDNAPDFSRKDLKEFKPIAFTGSEIEAITNTQNFAWNLLKAADKHDNGGNIMISPLTATLNLAMLANGAQGETLDQIISALNIEETDITELNSYAQKLTSEICTVDNSTDMRIANALYVNSMWSVNDSFKSVMMQDYNADILIDDNYDPVLINKWVANATKNKITELVDTEGSLADTKFAILNALYFDAIWSSPFSKDKTTEGIFHSSYHDCSASFMCERTQMLITQNDKFAICRLFFGNGAFSISFLLPHEGVELDDILPDIDYTKLAVMPSKDLMVNLRVPKFEINSDVDLIDPLKECGITHAFGDLYTDFSRLSDQCENIDVFRQMNKFGIDETGVKAVSVTISEDLCLLPDPIMDGGDFFIDRPFLFWIMENSSRTYLFMGKVEEIF